MFELCAGAGMPWSRRGLIVSMKMFLGLLILGMTCISCRFLEKEKSPTVPLSTRIFWEGHTAIAYSVDSSGMKASVVGKDSATRFVGTILHQLEFVGADTVHLALHEYDREYLAFSAFQDRASPAELEEGFYRERNNLVFYHGRFLGEMQYARPGLIPIHFLKENLSFLGEELFTKPPEFKAFPLLGRIPKSERVISRDFMGMHWRGSVFSVQYRCHADTATAFRALGQSENSFHGWVGKTDTLNWGREMQFQGRNEFHEALVFWVFPEGVLGISGCYDPVLAKSYAEKMQKMAVLWPKP